MKEKQQIKKLSEREHIKNRPSMYVGQIVQQSNYQWVLEEGNLVYKEISYVPALIKIINEIIDNSVDEFIKTEGKFANKISVNIDSETVTVQDNGRGIPVELNDGVYTPTLCWGHARSGSNFDDDDNKAQIGTNGVGGFATVVFSSSFVGETDDGKNRFKFTSKNNMESFQEKFISGSKERGTKVTFTPDLRSFNIDELSENVITIIKTRLANLVMTYDGLEIKFNSKKITFKNKKEFLNMFGSSYELFQGQDYFFAVYPNPEDEFRHFSYINGLYFNRGGTQIDLISSNISYGVRDLISKKYPSIKPADIKNKLLIVFVGKGFKSLKYDSQTKESVTNSNKDVSDYLGSVPWEDIYKKIFKNKDILEPITEVYKIKEEFKKRQELNALSKTVKEVKSDKYYTSTESKKYLVVVEGDSALGGLMPALGRKDCGYYTLRGVPLNAYSASHEAFSKNPELSDLFRIIKNEMSTEAGYKYLIIATDQDLDGYHIRGLMLGFIEKYLPELKGRVGFLQTPIIAAKKGKNVLRWSYSLNDKIELRSGEVAKYFKGLGTWNSEDLKQVIAIDGLEKMIDFIKFDDITILDDWLANDKSDKRKEYILKNSFDIAKA